MNIYLITLKHDNGNFTLQVRAETEQKARERVINAEGCPPRAIKKVRVLDMGNYVYKFFTLDAIARQFKGIHDPAVTWNGWACPLFTFNTAVKILNHLPMNWSYESSVDTFTYVSEFDEGPNITRGIAIDGKIFYAIGSHTWVWTASDKLENTEV